MIFIILGEKKMNDDIGAEEKILLVERLIQDKARSTPGTPEHRRHEVLKSIAADLRTQLQKTNHVALQALSFQVTSARRQKARIGYLEVGHQQALAEAVLAHWPAVRQALADASHAEEIRAERDMYHMMAHDLASDVVIEAITGRFPVVAARWKIEQGEKA